MKITRRLMVAFWGAFLLLPIYAQEPHLRTLAATGQWMRSRDALRSSSEITKGDANGVTALMLAAGSNHDPAVISLLVGAGAPVSVKSVIGESPLIFAAEYNPNPDIALTLLKAGADLEDRDGLGRTALMAAAWGNPNPAVVLALLKAGANALATSRVGKTALDYAEENSKLPRDSEAFLALTKATPPQISQQ